MDTNKTLNNLEKIKSVAIGFIGAGIATQGSMYFQEQSSYNIPRILYPVFEILGNKGLAVGMILLGLGAICFGYSKWKSNNGSSKAFAIIALASIIIFAGILFSTNKKKSTEEVLADSEKNRQEQLDEIMNMGKPDFDNPEIEKHFASFDVLYAKYQKSIKDKNSAEIQKLDNEFYTVYSAKTREIIQKLESDKIQEFGMYNAKLINKWQENKK